jgi:hypothetical protein
MGQTVGVAQARVKRRASIKVKAVRGKALGRSPWQVMALAN